MVIGQVIAAVWRVDDRDHAVDRIHLRLRDINALLRNDGGRRYMLVHRA
jgi:hypothetical protein